MEIGAQLYTVRSYMQDLKGFSETLKKVADIGYKYVQISGTCPYEAEWVKEELDKNGLKCSLTHYDINKIADKTDETVKFHNTFGCKNIGIGWGGLDDYEKYKEFVSRFLPSAKMIKEQGSFLTYHNHDMEYNYKHDGKKFIDLMCNDFSEDELGITLDVYWVAFAGYDPSSEIERIGKRIVCAHLKDLCINPDGTKRFGYVGEGELDFAKILSSLEKVGTKYAFVEQDDCYGKDPFDCLKKSYDYIKKLGYL